MRTKFSMLAGLAIAALFMGACGESEGGTAAQKAQTLINSNHSGAEALAAFVDSLEDCRLPTLNPEEELTSNEITKFVEEKLPSLGFRWKQIRREYNLNKRVIRLLEYKRAQLLEIASLEDTHIDLNSAPSYLKLLSRLKQNTKMLRVQHERILPVAEIFFAESAVRDVWSDEEMSEHINDLIRSADEILEITKMNIDMTMEGNLERRP